MSTILTLPKAPLHTKMWAQFSGIADCCMIGVIGRLGGALLPDNQREIAVSDGPVIKPYKSPQDFLDLVCNIMPKSRLYAGYAEWLYCAVLENALKKGTIGSCVQRICPDGMNYGKMDPENNGYHKFWAGTNMMVKSWALTSRMANQPKYSMTGACNADVNGFLTFVEENKLGAVDRSGPLPGMGTVQLYGAWWRPDFEAIRKFLEPEITKARNELQERWDAVKDKIDPNHKVGDVTACQW